MESGFPELWEVVINELPCDQVNLLPMRREGAPFQIKEEFLNSFRIVASVEPVAALNVRDGNVFR
ncbi:MAG TPA: hypothetical protein DEP85_00660 [Holosporales bacterium]|nr:hypothetical protein [Holosporales bacterium]